MNPEYSQEFPGASEDQALLAEISRLKEENARLNSKLTAVLTYPDYEGGVQFWIRRHDALVKSAVRATVEAKRGVAKMLMGAIYPPNCRCERCQQNRYWAELIFRQADESERNL